MEKAFKELILALRSIGDALMGKINSNNNNDEGGFLRNYNTVVGVKGIASIYRTNTYGDVIGIEDVVEETPVFLFDKTKSLNENFKLFLSQNVEFLINWEEEISEARYGFFPVYENNNNKTLYDFDYFDIDFIDITDEYDYDNLIEFLSSENCEIGIRCINFANTFNPTVREIINFIPVDNKHYIIFFNDYLTLQSNNNNPGDDDPSVVRSAKKSSSESEESFKSFINRLKENREKNKKEREERNEDRRKAFLEFLNKLKNTEEKEEEQKETTEEIKEEVKEEMKEEMKEEVKESEKSSESETKQEETK